MLKDTPSINKPRLCMAKFEVIGADVVNVIGELKCYRSGWSNDLREGHDFIEPKARDILVELSLIADSIINSLENRLNGRGGDRVLMGLVDERLTRLIKSAAFDDYACLSAAGVSHVITNGTKHHIRVMRECLEVLSKS